MTSVMLLSIPNFGSDSLDAKNKILKRRPFFMKKSALWCYYQSQILGPIFKFVSIQNAHFHDICEVEFWKKHHFFDKKSPLWCYYQSQISGPIFWMLKMKFWNEGRFSWKNQVCDTIINAKFWVRFSSLLASKMHIFTIYVRSNFGKNIIFSIKNHLCDAIINPKFRVRFFGC